MVRSILGVVLGDTIERYLFISVGRYGISFFARPVVAILFTIAIIGLARPFLQDIRSQGGVKRMLTSFQAPRFQVSQLLTIFMICLIATMVGTALQWEFSAKLVPLAIGAVALIAAGLSLFNDMCRSPESAPESLADHAIHEVARQIGTADPKMHMDLISDTAHLPTKVIIQRAVRFFGYLIGFMGVMAIIGLIPTVAVFVVIFMRYENQERWSLIIPYTVVLLVSISFVFDYVMSIPWPPTYIGAWFPALKFIPSV